MALRATRVVRVIVIIVIAVATSLLLYLLVNNFQFTRGRKVLAHFTSVGDLNVGAWVRKSGLKVGSVTRLEVASDETSILVTLEFKPGQIVREADSFALVAKGILGDMYIEQKPGPRDSPLAREGRLYEGEPSFNITDLLGGGTMNTITDLAGGLQKLITVLENNSDELDRSLKDIAATAKNVRIVTDRAVVLTESVPEISRQIAASIDRLQTTVEEVARTTETVLAQLQDRLVSSTDDLAASMKAIRKTSDDIQGAVSQLTAQNSVIAKLSAPGTAQSLDATMKNLEEISKSLLTVSQDAQKIVKGVSAILESP